MKPLVALALLLFSAGWIRGQVTVDISTEQDQFLRDEPLPVRMRIANHSGQTLKLGEEKDWLRFNVTRLDGSSVERQAEIPPTGEFELASGEAGSKTFDLQPQFDLTQPGRYQVTATLSIKQWGSDVTSKPVVFEISRGAKIWEQDFGVPGSGEPPEARKYALLQAMYHKRPQLYLRISDLAENLTHRIVALGPLVSFARPEAQLDEQIRVHVLYQAGAHIFVYHVIKPSGAVELRQFYDYTATRPRLTMDRKGVISVTGGQQRVTKQDIPAPPPDAIVPSIPPELFAATNAPSTTNATGKQKAADKKKSKRSE